MRKRPAVSSVIAARVAREILEREQRLERADPAAGDEHPGRSDGAGHAATVVPARPARKREEPRPAAANY